MRTFLIADIRGYTRYTHEYGDEEAAHLAALFAALARASAESHSGEVIELRGDEALAVFDSPRAALRAAVDLQEHCMRHTEADPEHPLQIGIGIDSGEAMQVEEGFRGSALNVASRLCDLAKPQQTLVSQGVVHLARKVPGLELVDQGTIDLRGVPEPLRVFEIASGEQPVVPRPQEQPPVVRKDPNADVRHGAMVTGLVGSSFAVGGLLLDLLISHLSTGKLVPLLGAVLSCLLGFTGAGAMSDHPTRGALTTTVAAIGLVIFVSWASIPGLILLVIAAGMAYFAGHADS